MKLLQSIGLITGSIVVMMVFGLPVYLFLWLLTFGLFLYSKLTGRAAVFADWSWPHFLATLGFSVGIGYGLLLSTAGF